MNRARWTVDRKKSEQGGGLRERKRRQTREAIERSAITLVSELGYQNVTVDAISERAMVSQGTFFNYFPTKDAAIVGVGSPHLDQRKVCAALDRSMPSTLFQAVLSLLLEIVRGYDWTGEIAQMRIGLVRDTPVLMKLFLSNSFAYIGVFKEYVTAYLVDHDDLRTRPETLSAAEEADLVVSLALEGAKFSLIQITRNPDSPIAEASDIESILRSVIA